MTKLITLIVLLITSFVNAQIVTIPDANFKNALLNQSPVIDTNSDNEIQVTEAQAATVVYVVNKNISDLTGIEAFTNMNILNCSNNSLTTIDLSANTALDQLNCSQNILTNLNISNNSNLTSLQCQNNQLTSLDISTNTALTSLDCSTNQLSTLDVSNLINLSVLQCHVNQLTSLDVSSNNEITELLCNDNELTSLLLSSNTAYDFVYCYNNQLTVLDLTNITISGIEGGLYCYNNSINNLIINNTSVVSITCYSNQLTSLDMANNPNLKNLSCSNNSINSLNISVNNALETLDVSSNQLTSLDVSNKIMTILSCADNNLTEIIAENTKIGNLTLDNNQFETLDFSQTELEYVHFSNNPNLSYINIKNGFFETGDGSFENLPNLETVCMDDIYSSFAESINLDTEQEVTLTEYCTLTPALSNQIYGNITYDIDNNGCDSTDVKASNLMVITDNGTESFASFTQANGDYLLYTNEGNFETKITTNLPSYYTVTPNVHNSNFVGYDNTAIGNFCIVANESVDDVSVTILPIIPARPGFDAKYKLIYKNSGTTPLNGAIMLTFDNTQLNFIATSSTDFSQADNTLNFNYTLLNPFETREIDVEFHVEDTATIDAVLDFTVSISPLSNDNTPSDNSMNYNQTIIGSYDPNDIHILEGKHISIYDVDNYVHYLIRFQNTGTADAINIVVKNKLDANLDWSTLQLESTSHPSRVAIANGNAIEFIFENIHLPDSTTNYDNSQGYIAYRIKPKHDISVGELIPNKAHIFFDFNAAVDTNTASTEIVNTASINDVNAQFVMIYPNPTKGLLQIHTKNTIVQADVFSNLGKLVFSKTEKDLNTLDLHVLSKGFYLLKLKDINGYYRVKKIVIE